MKTLTAGIAGLGLMAAMALTPLLAHAEVRSSEAPAASTKGSGKAPAAGLKAINPLGMSKMERKKSPMARLDPSLMSLSQQMTPSLRGVPSLKTLKENNSFLRLRTIGPAIAPSVLVDATSKASGPALRAALQSLGMRGGSTFGNVVSGWLPAGQLAAAAALPELAGMRASMMQKRAGASLTQGDFAQRSNRLRAPLAALPKSGAGIKVGVLSDSFGCIAGGAAAGVASGDLPAEGVTVLKEEPGCGSGSDEGRAMAELIHDVAPGAAISFYTAFDGEADFANGILALAADGAKVIVDDVGYFAEPVFQDGIIGNAINQVAAQGVAYFSSAGNNGRNSYEAPYGDGSVLDELGPSPDYNPGAGVATVLPITLPANSTTFIFLHWDEPYRSGLGTANGPGSASDVDFCLTFDDGTIIDPDLCGFSFNVDADPVEIIGVSNSGGAFTGGIKIGVFEGPVPGRVKVIYATNGQAPDGSIGGPFATNSGTIQGHPQALGAAAVGAAFFRRTPECGTSPALKEAFSSAGGTPTLFTANGVRLTTPVTRLKPNFTGPDGGNTTFFGGDATPASGIAGLPAECRDDDTNQGNFFGTSASAPHVAGIAALLMEGRPSLLPTQIHQALASTTSEMLTPGFDFETGTGFVRADAAAAALVPVVVGPRLTTPVISGASTSNTPAGSEAPAGVYQFTAQVCTKAGESTLNGLFTRTTQLTNGNSLISRSRAAPTGPAGGVGSEQDFTPNAGYADGLLAASECTNQLYRVGLANKNRFTFTVEFRGNLVP